MPVPQGVMWLKAIAQTCFIVSLGLILFTFNHLLGMIVLFAGYFSLPVTYTVKRPFKAAQAWLRLVVGGFAAFAMLLTFMLGGISVLSGTVSVGMFFITWAFLMVLPERKEGTTVPFNQWAGAAGAKAIATMYGFSAQMGPERFGKLLFFILWVIGFIFSMPMFIGVPGWLSGVTLAFLLIGLVAGIFAGRAARPAIGMFLIVLMLFSFSYAYTETMGRVIFGYWWPQVQSAVAPVYEQVMQQFRNIQSMWEDTTLLATCPQCYYQRQLIRQQAAASAEGSVSSLTFTDFRVIPSEMIEPVTEPKGGGKSVVYLQVENTGEFAADGVTITIQPPQTKVTKCVFNGAVTTEVKPKDAAETINVTTCSGGTPTANKRGCRWDGLSYPDTVRMATFEIKWNDFLADCATDPETQMQYFIYGGETVTLRPEVTFNYFVNVIYPMRVMNGASLDAALIGKSVSLTEQIAKYSGGPLKASLWTPLQPLRSGDKNIVTASLENTQDGDVKGAEYCIYLPKVGPNLEIPDNVAGAVIGDGDANVEVGNCGLEPGTWVVSCSMGDIRAQANCPETNLNCNIKRCSFYAFYDIGDSTERTFNLRGVSTYRYTVKDSKDMMVAAASAEQAAGAGKDKCAASC